jgi:hypothetical protein
LNKARSGYRFDLTNPVRRGLVERPTDWLWSSARDWAGLDGAWLKVDRTLLTLHPDGQ